MWESITYFIAVVLLPHKKHSLVVGIQNSLWAHLLDIFNHSQSFFQECDAFFFFIYSYKKEWS